MKKIGNKPAAQVFFFLPPMSPKITLEKEKKKTWKQRGERKEAKKKAMAALLVSFC